MPVKGPLPRGSWPDTDGLRSPAAFSHTGDCRFLEGGREDRVLLGLHIPRDGASAGQAAGAVQGREGGGEVRLVDQGLAIWQLRAWDHLSSVAQAPGKSWASVALEATDWEPPCLSHGLGARPPPYCY